jgi:vesicle coat complex subunit
MMHISELLGETGGCEEFDPILFKARPYYQRDEFAVLIAELLNATHSLLKTLSYDFLVLVIVEAQSITKRRKKPVCIDQKPL